MDQYDGASRIQSGDMRLVTSEVNGKERLVFAEQQIAIRVQDHLWRTGEDWKLTDGPWESLTHQPVCYFLTKVGDRPEGATS